MGTIDNIRRTYTVHRGAYAVTLEESHVERLMLENGQPKKSLERLRRGMFVGRPLIIGGLTFVGRVENEGDAA